MTRAGVRVICGIPKEIRLMPDPVQSPLRARAVAGAAAAVCGTGMCVMIISITTRMREGSG